MKIFPFGPIFLEEEETKIQLPSSPFQRATLTRFVKTTYWAWQPADQTKMKTHHPGKLNLGVAAFLWSGGSLSHLQAKHLDTTTTTTKPPAAPGRFPFPIISLPVNLRPPGNWGFPSSTWELRLIAPDLFLFFHELVMLLWQGNKAFWFVKQFIQVTLGGSIWCLRGGIPVDYPRSIGTKMRDLCWF